MKLFDPTQQAYQRRIFDTVQADLTRRGYDNNIAAFSKLRQEFILTGAADLSPVFDFKTPGAGRANASGQNSATEVLLQNASRFIALYLGIFLFRRDDTAATGLGSSASIDYTYPSAAVFIDAGATTAFTSLEQVYNGVATFEQNKSKTFLSYPMKAFRHVPEFISRNTEAAAADTELYLQPYQYGQGFVPLVPRWALAGDATNKLTIESAGNVNNLFAIAPTAPAVRYGIAVELYGISLDNVTGEVLTQLANLG
jgi:hypothetical protein